MKITPLAGFCCCILFNVFCLAQGPLTTTVHSTNSFCKDPCTGSASAEASGGTAPYHYLWMPGNDTAATDSNLCAGNYTVIVTDSVGNTDTAIADILALHAPQATLETADTVIRAGDSTQICVTQTFEHYLWEIGDTTRCIEAFVAGRYFATVSDSNNCIAFSDSIYIFTCPVLSVSILTDSDTVSVFGFSCPVTFLWYRNGMLVSESDSFFVPTQAGNYVLEIAFDSSCCGGVDTLIAWYDTIAVTDVIDLGIGMNASIFPNPTSGNWQLAVNDNLLGTDMEIFDSEGRKIYYSKISNLKSTINLDVAPGVYLMYIDSQLGNFVRKLVKI